MTTQVLPTVLSNEAPSPFHLGLSVAPSASEQWPLLLLSDDEKLWQNLLAAAGEAGRKLVRQRVGADAPWTVRLLKPAAVLLDLDSPNRSAWDVVDSLLQDENCPPVLLFTSRRWQPEFQTAMEAGALLDKGTDATRLMALVKLKSESSSSTQSEHNRTQRVIIRWLKPSDWLAPVVPLGRFWGINE